MTDVVLVFGVALLTAAATGLGALPFAMFHGAERWLGPANGVASGVMLAASASLAFEGATRSVGRTTLGAVAGAVFVLVVHGLVHDRKELVLGSLRGADAYRALLVIGVMTAHSAAEGIGIGAAFGDGRALGLGIATAIAVQNVPEGLAISLVLVPRGTRVRTAAAWSVFSSLPQPLLAVPAFLFVEEFQAVLPAGLGFAAGAMIFLVARDLLPDALRRGPRGAVLVALVASFVPMLVLQLWLAG